ncbi:hypothetical protein, unlikely [Trypanosoma brucei brucei TREU927]|uniref:Uncharacterized protein n=1 Tax=Trypanosoma brucei brucei (strain 927/4 GUTat10.1) TaxID=185431 RepID=Q38DD8_TRYB2|nr:hypothetical protein, unlikely [Trypanosoma brucei brucei TREU927]EAN77182.1 hypothetical protein, unlikely [Trypanosoma brucei brucei TREU927]
MSAPVDLTSSIMLLFFFFFCFVHCVSPFFSLKNLKKFPPYNDVVTQAGTVDRACFCCVCVWNNTTYGLISVGRDNGWFLITT